MTQSAKVQEPSMEEILASIRRIIADDDTNKPAAPMAAAPAPQRPAPPPLRPVAPPPRPAAVAPPPVAPAPARDDAQIQNDIDSVLGAPPAPITGNGAAHPDGDILDLTEDMKNAAPPAASFRTIDGQPDVIFAENEPEPEPAPEPKFQEPRFSEPRFSESKSSAELTHALEETARQFSQGMEDERPLLSSAATVAVDSAFNTLAHTVLVQNGRTLEDLVREMLRPMLKSWLDDNLPGLVERLVRSEIERVSRGR